VSIVTPEYLLPSQLSPMLASTYSFTSAAIRKPVHTARRSGRNLSGDDPLSNQRVQKSPFLCVNRSPINYVFLFCASATLYSVNITLLQNRRYLSLFLGERGRARGEHGAIHARIALSLLA